MPAPRSQMPKGWETSLFHLTCRNLHLEIARGVELQHARGPAKTIEASAEKRFTLPRAGLLPCYTAAPQSNYFRNNFC